MLPRVLTAIVTPFDEHDKIDMDSFIELIRFQLLHDCGVVLFGTTGECPTVSDYERANIYINVVKNFNENKFVIGVGGNNTKECIHQIDLAKSYGFTNFMLTVPYYNKPTQHGLEKHFTYICNLYPQDKFILYNVPSRCGVNMLPITVKNIFTNTQNVIAIKEASGDLSQMIQIRELCPNLELYSGDDGIVLPVLSIGGVGVISVVSNILPEIVLSMINEYFLGNLSIAQKHFYNLRPFVKFCFIETNPVPVKYMLSVLSEKESLANVRLPLVGLSNESKKLHQELSV